MGRISMKCPCCGAELLFGADGITLSCEYCGHTEYWKEEKTEKVISELDRANAMRRENAFSDAIREYKLITEQNPDDAEAHWGLVISLYGIEFIKDRRTNRFIPTCHRTVRDSILENPDYLKAVECASEEQAEEYKRQAVEIDRLQKEILRLSEAEEEYDVFISFKSTDERGRITRDAQIARIIYDELTKRGIKTFFSDVTLENKLFDAFEPIIFRALFSCKFFILVGTKNEFINSPWVKNEWSRFAERMETERLSGVACAVFDGAEVDLPDFVRAQGIDLRRYAAGGYEMHVADAVEKKLGRKKKSKEEEEILRQIEAQKQAQRELEERLKGLQQGGPAAPQGGASATVNSLLMRARQELEVRNWDTAKEYYGRVLDADPQNADAWWGLFLIDRSATDDKEAENSVGNKTQFSEVVHNRNFMSAKRYAAGKTAERVEEFEKRLKTEEPLLARADAMLKKKNFAGAEEVSNLLLASEPENAKAWWRVLLAQENCVNEEEFLSRCDWDNVGRTVNRLSYLNAYKFAKDDFRAHLDEIRKKICGYFEPKAQECREKVIAFNNEAEAKQQSFNQWNAAKEKEIDKANANVSKVLAQYPILRSYREQGTKKVPVKKCFIAACVFAVLMFGVWIALIFTAFQDLKYAELSSGAISLITWDMTAYGDPKPVDSFPLFLIQAAIYGVLFGLGILILLLIIAGICVKGINAKNYKKARLYNAAGSVMNTATSARDKLHREQASKRNALRKELDDIYAKQRYEQAKLDNYECFINGDYANITGGGKDPVAKQAAVSDATSSKKKGKKNASSAANAAEYDWYVELLNCGDNKIQVIKVIRSVMNGGLAEAKDLAEKGGVIVSELDEKSAADLAGELRSLGAVVRTGAVPRTQFVMKS